jgi:hypothetical protein
VNIFVYQFNSPVNKSIHEVINNSIATEKRNDNKADKNIPMKGPLQKKQ